LLVSRNATGVNKADLARSKRKIRMPEIEKEKEIIMAYSIFITFIEFDNIHKKR
jgi:hypothetical protein